MVLRVWDIGTSPVHLLLPLRLRFLMFRFVYILQGLLGIHRCPFSVSYEHLCLRDTVNFVFSKMKQAKALIFRAMSLYVI